MDVGDYNPPKEDEDRPARIKRVRSRRRKSKVPAKNWSCGHCNKEFSAYRLVLQHRREVHLTEENDHENYTFLNELYRCKCCNLTTTKEHEMEKHVTCHVDAYDCAICNESFCSAYKYACHVRSHGQDDLLCCPLCDLKTSKPSCLLQHIDRKHLNKFLYYCKYCGKGFNDIVIFKEHQDFHAFGKFFSCVVCQQKFLYSRYLLTHQIRSHSVFVAGNVVKNQCAVCKKIFTKDVSLQNHMVTNHAGSRTHLCDYCGKDFPTRTKLNLHHRIHTGVKPYSCSYCEKRFSKKDYLVLHVRTHTGEKPYSCKYCGKSFSQPSTLRTHVRSHTGERPYVCHICFTGFSVKSSLIAHYRSCKG